jgi:hypothetical protein
VTIVTDADPREAFLDVAIVSFISIGRAPVSFIDEKGWIFSPRPANFYKFLTNVGLLLSLPDLNVDMDNPEAVISNYFYFIK